MPEETHVQGSGDPQDPRKLEIIESGEEELGDPEYMTLEEDSQEAFDAMWKEGDTITPDGYLLRALDDEER